MARRRKTAETVSEPLAEQPTNEETPQAAAGPEVPPIRKRLVIPIREDGLDVGNLSVEEKDRIRTALGSPAATEVVDPALVAIVLTSIGSLEATMLAAKFGIDRAKAQEIVGPHEPTRSMIAEVGARVITKYGIVGKYADEIMLAGLLVMWQTGVMEAFRAAATQENPQAYNQTRNARTPKDHGRTGGLSAVTDASPESSARSNPTS